MQVFFFKCPQTKIFVQTFENFNKLFRKTPTRPLANLVVYQMYTVTLSLWNNTHLELDLTESCEPQNSPEGDSNTSGTSCSESELPLRTGWLALAPAVLFVRLDELVRSSLAWEIAFVVLFSLSLDPFSGCWLKIA